MAEVRDVRARLEADPVERGALQLAVNVEIQAEEVAFGCDPAGRLPVVRRQERRVERDGRAGRRGREEGQEMLLSGRRRCGATRSWIPCDCALRSCVSCQSHWPQPQPLRRPCCSACCRARRVLTSSHWPRRCRPTGGRQRCSRCPPQAARRSRTARPRVALCQCHSQFAPWRPKPDTMREARKRRVSRGRRERGGMMCACVCLCVSVLRKSRARDPYKNNKESRGRTTTRAPRVLTCTW